MLLKKALVLSLSLIMCLGLCGCNKNKKQNDADEATSIYTPIFNAYSDFISEKSEVFGDFTSRVYSERSLLLPTGTALLNISEAELAFLPLSLLQNAEKNGGHFEGSSMGCTDCVTNVSDGSFELSYSKYDGTREVIRGSFDEKTKVFYCELLVDSVLTMSMEFKNADKGYSVQYINYEDGNAVAVRLKMDDKSIGIATVSGNDIPRIKNVPEADFLKSDSLSVLLKGDKLSATVDGEKAEFE